MIAGSIRRIERTSYVLGGVLVIGAALTQSRRVALGVAVGVALSCLNFAVLGRLVGRWTSEAAAGEGGGGALLVLPKMVALMAAVVLALKYLPIDAAGLAVGFSVLFASILVDATLAALRPSPLRPSSSTMSSSSSSTSSGPTPAATAARPSTPANGSDNDHG